jgi:hypothetical protein
VCQAVGTAHCGALQDDIALAEAWKEHRSSIGWWCLRCFALASRPNPPRAARNRRHDVKRGAQRHLKPGIFIELAPTGEGEASAWLQRCAQIGKGAGRLREKHEANARKKEIERRSKAAYSNW